MTDKPHTPTTEDIRRSYIYAESSSFHAIKPDPKGGPLAVECERPIKVARHRDTEEYRLAEGEFDRWLAARDARIIAAAEQRGAERAFDEAVEEIASMEGNRMILARYKHLNPYRADLMEGDDGDV